MNNMKNLKEMRDKAQKCLKDALLIAKTKKDRDHYETLAYDRYVAALRAIDELEK